MRRSTGKCNWGKEIRIMMVRIADRLVRVGKDLVNTLRYLCVMDKSSRLVVNAWMDLYGKEPVHRNLGDELNYYLIRELTGKRIFNYFNMRFLKIRNYCCIGSIVDSCNKRSYIWGTGAMSQELTVSGVPLKVCAVRGPLTRECLLAHGIECPEVYGDPALLLPLIYKPQATKRYKVGIIPHICDFDNPLVGNLARQKKGEELIIIKMGDYADWHDVIDEINECEFIVSSSLHGLILSDAYNIPNVWVEFSDKVLGNGFKFRDYFASVGKDSKAVPIRITAQTKLAELLSYKDRWHPIEIDLGKLIDACPFETQPQYRNIQ